MIYTCCVFGIVTEAWEGEDRCPGCGAVDNVPLYELDWREGIHVTSEAKQQLAKMGFEVLEDHNGFATVRPRLANVGGLS